MRQSNLRPWTAFLILCAAVVAIVYLIAAQTERDMPRGNLPREIYSRIEDSLFLGGLAIEPPPGTRAVLNVCEEEDPYRAEVHRWEPLPDLGPAPDLAWLRSQVAFIDEQRQAGRPIYVHCRAGINRGAMVVAAYLMWRDRLSGDDALAVLRSQRPWIGPYPVYRKFLAEWEESLKCEATPQ